MLLSWQSSNDCFPHFKGLWFKFTHHSVFTLSPAISLNTWFFTTPKFLEGTKVAQLTIFCPALGNFAMHYDASVITYNFVSDGTSSAHNALEVLYV